MKLKYFRLLFFFFVCHVACGDWLSIENNRKLQCGSWGCAQLFVDAAGRFYFSHQGRSYWASANVADAILQQPDYRGKNIVPHKLRARAFYADASKPISSPTQSVAEPSPSIAPAIISHAFKEAKEFGPRPTTLGKSLTPVGAAGLNELISGRAGYGFGNCRIRRSGQLQVNEGFVSLRPSSTDATKANVTLIDYPSDERGNLSVGRNPDGSLATSFLANGKFSVASLSSKDGRTFVAEERGINVIAKYSIELAKDVQGRLIVTLRTTRIPRGREDLSVCTFSKLDSI